MNLRPVMVAMNNKEHKGLFHKFYTKYDVIPASLMVGGHAGGQITIEMALVELNDGTIISTHTSNIRFIDSHIIFDEFIFTNDNIRKEQ